MKYQKLICVLLACVMLCGCSLLGGRAEGDMEKALTALEWQDYDTAIAESEAFLKRVPHSTSAMRIRETAGWGKFFLIEDEAPTVSQGTVTFQNGYRPIRVDVPYDSDIDACLESFYIELDFDSSYFTRDVAVSTVSSVYIHLDSDASAYRDDDRGTLNARYLRKTGIHEDDPYYLNSDYNTDDLIQQINSTVIPTLSQIFAHLKKNYGITPEQLGFRDWNK